MASHSIKDVLESPLLDVGEEDALSSSQRQQLQQILKERAAQHQSKLASISLLRHPLTTLRLFLLAVLDLITSFLRHASRHGVAVFLVFLLLALGTLAYLLPGSHQATVQAIEQQLLLALWWIGLGVLSSVGLGTGLHTFLLYVYYLTLSFFFSHSLFIFMFFSCFFDFFV